MVANFCEVFLAKEGHDGVVGINYLRKIELPIPFACLGAMLAGVDYVLVGAGSPAELPELIRRLARRDGVALSVRTQGTTSADGEFAVRCSPRALLGAGPPLHRPQLLAIVASTDLAAGLAADPVTRPDGFVIEGHTAGGHNAPPRGPRRTTPSGEPVYDERDTVDLDAVRELGLPFWLAGSQGSPEGLRAAVAAGAAGVQVGTAFAFCAESSLADGAEAAGAARSWPTAASACAPTGGCRRPGSRSRCSRCPGPCPTPTSRPVRTRLRHRRAAESLPPGRRHDRLPLSCRADQDVRRQGRPGRQHRGPGMPVQRVACHCRPPAAAPTRLRRARHRHVRGRLQRRGRPHPVTSRWRRPTRPATSSTTSPRRRVSAARERVVRWQRR